LSISLNIQNLYKKFGNQWVLKSLNLTVYPFEKIAILGANGSGKSTLLKIMAGFLYFDKGKLSWIKNDQELESPDFTFSSPYIDLFEHLTIEEHIEFHFNQKPTWNAIRTDEIIRLGNLDIHRKKQIKQLSSGIKQRFKNTLAIFTSAEVLFLDEPCSNMDEENIKLYQKLVSECTKDRMVIIASNNPSEYDFICSKEFKIENGDFQLLKNKQLWV
jgi:ABC-type multidrug transport system ATPase subunit